MIQQISKDERANALTHFAGIVLSLVGIPVIFKIAIPNASGMALFGVGAFSFGLLAVYISSTVYHSVSRAELKTLWRKIDHIAIYFLIAGTYTAYILRYLDESIGHIFLITHWIMVLGGIIFKYFYTGKYELFSTMLYLLLGWMVVFIIQPLIANMNEGTLFFIIVGGAAYSIGVIFYVWERYKINHSIWHIFVLLGSAAHYFGLYLSY